MKIAILVKNFKPPWNEGAKNNIRNISLGLKKKGHEISFLSLSDENRILELEEGRAYLFKSLFYKIKFRYLFYPFGFLSLLIGSCKAVRKERPDILISSFGTSSFLIFFIRFLSGINFKTVQFIYNDWYSFQKVPFKVWLLEHLYQSLFNNKFLSKISLFFADKVITTSRYLQNELIKIGYENVKFIPTGVDINEFAPDISRRKKYKEKTVVAYIGHLLHSKGVSLLLEALLPLLDKENMRLIIASSHSGLDETILKKLSHPRVTLLGTVRARDIYNSCDILVYPRRFSFQTVIYPNVILEAMSCATAVLTTRLPAIDEIIKDGENGFLIEPNDVIGLRNRLNEIVRDKTLLEKVGYEARKTIESKFNWDRIIPEIEKELILSLVQFKSKNIVYEQEEKVYNYEKRRFGSCGGRLINKKELDKISELSEATDGCKILELGCGTGRLTKSISQKGYSLVSVDRSWVMLATCRKNVGNSVNLIRSDIENLPLKEGIFDACISLRLMHHFKYNTFDKVLKELKRCLRDNGAVIFNTTNIFSFSILSRWTNFFPHNFSFHHYSNEKKIEQILRDNKFNIIDKQTIFFIPSFVFRIIKNRFLADILWKLNEKLEKLFPNFCSMTIWKARITA